MRRRRQFWGEEAMCAKARGERKMRERAMEKDGARNVSKDQTMMALESIF